MRKKFFDRAKVILQSGKGGNGCISFRRERYIPKGGPDGGDGGDGGDVVLIATSKKVDFHHIFYKRRLSAENGKNGQGKQKSGERGKDLLIEVPVGTLLKTADKVIIHEFLNESERFVLLKGGHGGKGNIHYKTSTLQKPEIAEDGEKARESEFFLELKIIADIALIGQPNVGKSTLLKTLTSSITEVGNYPFTTLTPQLGIYRFPDDYLPPIKLAEIPGLIEGAHMGKGLGHEFLRHANRALHFFILLDATSQDIVKDYEQIKKELSLYDKNLLKKSYDLVITKIDLAEESAKESAKDSSKDSSKKFPKESLKEKLQQLQEKIVLKKAKKKLTTDETEKIINEPKIFPISCHENTGLDHLKNHLSFLTNFLKKELASYRFEQLDKLLKTYSKK